MGKFFKMLFEAIANGFKVMLNAIKEAAKATTEMLTAAAVAVGYLAYNAAKIFVGVPCAAAYTFVAGMAIVGLGLAGAGSDFVYRKNGQKRSSNTTVSGILSSVAAVWGFAASPITNAISSSAESMTDTERFGSKTTPTTVGELPVSLRSSRALSNTESVGILDHQQPRNRVQSTPLQLQDRVADNPIDEGVAAMGSDSEVGSDGVDSSTNSTEFGSESLRALDSPSSPSPISTPEISGVIDEGVEIRGSELPVISEVETAPSLDPDLTIGERVASKNIEAKEPSSPRTDDSEVVSNRLETGTSPSRPLEVSNLQKGLHKKAEKPGSITSRHQ